MASFLDAPHPLHSPSFPLSARAPQASASQFVGKWVTGSLAEGRWIMRDGSTFVGSFNGGKLKAGAYTFKSTNNTQTGKFNENDTFTGGAISAAAPEPAAA